MGKGNGDDKSVQDAKNQMAFLDEVKKLAKQHGIKIGGDQAGLDPLRQSKDLKVQVMTRDDKIIIDFGQSVSWMAMNAQQATKFAATVIKQVQNIQSIGATGGQSSDPEHYKDLVDGGREGEDPDAEKKDVDKPE